MKLREMTKYNWPTAYNKPYMRRILKRYSRRQLRRMFKRDLRSNA